MFPDEDKSQNKQTFLQLKKEEEVLNIDYLDAKVLLLREWQME